FIGAPPTPCFLLPLDDTFYRRVPHTLGDSFESVEKDEEISTDAVSLSPPFSSTAISFARFSGPPTDVPAPLSRLLFTVGFRLDTIQEQTKTLSSPNRIRRWRRG
ncbi:unnamed protein product, partial [Ectocarpus sp. 8 AP-2014]